MTKILLLVLAVYHGINGALMLAAPEIWYSVVPGVEHTGPINIHFVRDIGLGFLAAAMALVLVARGHMGTLAPALVFLGGHAALHVFEMLTHGTTATAATKDFATIILPALLPLIALRPAPAIPTVEGARRATRPDAEPGARQKRSDRRDLRGA
jgi:hypothetical protein